MRCSFLDSDPSVHHVTTEAVVAWLLITVSSSSDPTGFQTGLSWRDVEWTLNALGISPGRVSPLSQYLPSVNAFVSAGMTDLPYD